MNCNYWIIWFENNYRYVTVDTEDLVPSSHSKYPYLELKRRWNHLTEALWTNPHLAFAICSSHRWNSSFASVAHLPPVLAARTYLHSTLWTSLLWFPSVLVDSMVDSIVWHRVFFFFFNFGPCSRYSGWRWFWFFSEWRGGRRSGFCRAISLPLWDVVATSLYTYTDVASARMNCVDRVHIL